MVCYTMTVPSPLHVVIAIDGPSGAGKSTVAKRLAQRLGYHYVDSGALYRAVGWVVQTHAIPFQDTAAILALLERTTITMTFCDGQSAVLVNGQDITSQLRGEAVGKAASVVATLPAVRQRVTSQLRRLRCQASLVMEGRDIGTVVFPEATAKFFLDASLAVRSQRRWQEMHQVGQTATHDEVTQAVAARDAQDRSRPEAPLVRAAEARVIDTTDLTVDDVVQIMVSEMQLNFLQSDG